MTLRWVGRENSWGGGSTPPPPAIQTLRMDGVLYTHAVAVHLNIYRLDFETTRVQFCVLSVNCDTRAVNRLTDN